MIQPHGIAEGREDMIAGSRCQRACAGFSVFNRNAISIRIVPDRTLITLACSGHRD